MLTGAGEERTPDIVASADTGWLVLELTTQIESKAAQLDKYKSIDPRSLPQFGLVGHREEPDTMSCRLSFVDDGPHCQILVRDKLTVDKEDYVANHDLKEALAEARGTDLTKLPEIPISLLPEMKSAGEIRRGLIDIVMQVFEPNSSGKNPAQLVDEGLERLHDKIGPHNKHSLQDRVKYQMGNLIARYIPEYLEYKDDVYQVTQKWKQHHKTMGHIAMKLKEWAGEGPKLEDFHVESSDNDGEK